MSSPVDSIFYNDSIIRHLPMIQSENIIDLIRLELIYASLMIFLLLFIRFDYIYTNRALGNIISRNDKNHINLPRYYAILFISLSFMGVVAVGKSALPAWMYTITVSYLPMLVVLSLVLNPRTKINTILALIIAAIVSYCFIASVSKLTVAVCGAALGYRLSSNHKPRWRLIVLGSIAIAAFIFIPFLNIVRSILQNGEIASADLIIEMANRRAESPSTREPEFINYLVSYWINRTIGIDGAIVGTYLNEFFSIQAKSIQNVGSLLLERDGTGVSIGSLGQIIFLFGREWGCAIWLISIPTLLALSQPVSRYARRIGMPEIAFIMQMKVTHIMVGGIRIVDMQVFTVSIILYLAIRIVALQSFSRQPRLKPTASPFR